MGRVENFRTQPYIYAANSFLHVVIFSGLSTPSYHTVSQFSGHHIQQFQDVEKHSFNEFYESKDAIIYLCLNTLKSVV